MPIPSKKRMRRTVVMFAVLFVALFFFRFLYGYYGRVVENTYSEVGYDFFSNVKDIRENYATEKIANNIAPQDVFAAQKYEKTATVRAETSHFVKDDSLIRGSRIPMAVRSSTN